VVLIINRAYGFHSAGAALALIMVTLGPINHVLPHERGQIPKSTHIQGLEAHILDIHGASYVLGEDVQGMAGLVQLAAKSWA
jgi:hypothetical protein